MTDMDTPRREIGDKELEGMLRNMALDEPSPRLRGAVLALARPRPMAVFWPFGPFWQPMTVLAAAAVIGVVLGSWSPAPSLVWEEEVMQVAFALDTGEAP